MNWEPVINGLILLVLSVSPPVVKQLVKTATREIIEEQTKTLRIDFDAVKDRQDSFESQLDIFRQELHLVNERVGRIENKTATIPSMRTVVDQIKEKVNETS